ncbi:glutaredoxin-C9-like [Hibiscus syriacus]|nr:glutaredoxin-C9-like [Hibiscus syriacus]
MASNIGIETEAPPTTMMVDHPYKMVRQLASTNAVVLFSMSWCCMCTVAKRLLFGLGVGPTIIELDHHGSGPDIQAILFQLVADGRQPVPAVFVGGKFLGGIETLMACHINGTLVPLLKEAGALWL